MKPIVLKTGIASYIGFVDSLQLLIEDEQYSLTDIALMFGVCTNRISQLAQKYGFDYPCWGRGLSAVRVWDDSLNRFRPIKRSVARKKYPSIPVRERATPRIHGRGLTWVIAKVESR